jgi:hypothetical protein
MAKLAFTCLNPEEQAVVMKFLCRQYDRGVEESEDTAMAIIRYSNECMERRYMITRFMNKL